MDLKELTSPKIYESIQSSLKTLRLQHQEISFLDFKSSSLKDLVENILKPTCSILKIEKLTCLSEVRTLLNAYQAFVKNERSSFTNKKCNIPSPPGSTTRAAQTKRPRPRSLPTGVCYPAISSRLTQSPCRSYSCASFTSSLHRVTSPSASVKNQQRMNLDSIQRCRRLNQFVADLETRHCKLQELFTTFTQRVLVPLQVFCKHTRTRKRIENEKDLLKNLCASEVKLPKDSDQSEFVLVEMLNRIRQLLWPSDCVLPEQHITSDNQLLSSEDDQQFPVLNVHSYILSKFSITFDCASLWLKRDQIYTENARCGFLRAQRRFVKMQRMWQEVRKAQRKLSNDWNHAVCAIESNEMRLETLQNEIETLRENIVKLQDERQTVEVKLLNATENIDCVRSTHRNLRKRINSSCKRLEARERAFELMKSRVRSVNADKDALREKLKINWELVESLQERMIGVFRDKEAWKKRYEEKTDPEILQRRLDSVGLRIPSLVVREKTFVLRSRTENLQEAISIVHDRLKASDTHWSTLCHRLNWPQAFLTTILSSNPRIRRRAFCESSSSSSSTSSPAENKTDSGKDGKVATPPKAPATQRIVNYIKTTCQGSNDEQCKYMLKLWLEKNGLNASLGQLVRALQEVRQLENNLASESSATRD